MPYNLSSLSAHDMQGAPASTPSRPVILRLTIQRFRGIQFLQWYPAQGMNVLLGGGDVGKTTILETIAVVLSPTNSIVLSDADYWQRDVESGFQIEAVMLIPESSVSASRLNTLGHGNGMERSHTFHESTRILRASLMIYLFTASVPEEHLTTICCLRFFSQTRALTIFR